EVVYQGLKQGCKITAFCREPSKLVVPAGSGGGEAGTPISDPNLRTVQGTVTSREDVDKVFEGEDITGVVIALGGKTKDVGATMLTDGTANIISAMKEKGVKRVGCMTSIGVGDSEKQAPIFFKARSAGAREGEGPQEKRMQVLMYTVMKGIFEDKNNQEALFTKGPGSDLDYTIVRPGGLTVEPPTGIVNVVKNEAGSITRADVATFLLGSVTDEEWAYNKQAPCISSVGGTSWVKDRSKAARGEM
ncbi:unnamed protein product, partial [Discosporangium mesarthrocarpum]